MASERKQKQEKSLNLANSEILVSPTLCVKSVRSTCQFITGRLGASAVSQKTLQNTCYNARFSHRNDDLLTSLQKFFWVLGRQWLANRHCHYLALSKTTMGLGLHRL